MILTVQKRPASLVLKPGTATQKAARTGCQTRTVEVMDGRTTRATSGFPPGKEEARMVVLTGTCRDLAVVIEM